MAGHGLQTLRLPLSLRGQPAAYQTLARRNGIVSSGLPTLCDVLRAND